jgi:hypothetical protein
LNYWRRLYAVDAETNSVFVVFRLSALWRAEGKDEG